MTDPSQLQIDSPSILADLQRVVAGEVGANTRRLMLLVLATGLVLISVTQYGATAAGLTLVHTLAGTLPEANFILAVALLGILSALAAALPPALAAARTDPVRILRVP